MNKPEFGKPNGWFYSHEYEVDDRVIALTSIWIENEITDDYDDDENWYYTIDAGTIGTVWHVAPKSILVDFRGYEATFSDEDENWDEIELFHRDEPPINNPAYYDHPLL